MKAWHSCPGCTSISTWFSLLWNQGPSAVTRYVYTFYKSQAPLIPYSAALVVVVLYALADHLHNLVCMIIISQYNDPYTTPLALVQVVLNILALLVLRSLGVLKLNPFSWSLAKQLMVPAVCGSVQCVLTLWARAHAHSGLYSLTGCFLPLFTLAWGHLLVVRKPGSPYSTFLLTAITFTSVGITVYQGVFNVEPLEYFYSPLSLFLHSISLTWLSKIAQTEHGHATPFDLYYTLTMTRSVLLVLLCVAHPDTPRAVTHGSWQTLYFLVYMLAMLLLGSIQIFLVDITAIKFSPLSAALLHSARGLALPLIKLL